MALRRHIVWTAAAGVSALALLATPAAAQGLFEQLFGGLRQIFRAPPPPPPEFAPGLTSYARAVDAPMERTRGGNGPARAFCVRTCDGHYFPVEAHAGLSAAQACSAFCPASRTQLFSGSNIDYARAPDGSRYADQPNAYLYRKHLVSGCTCNGRTAFGVMRITPAQDPTLRPGDVVATQNGLMAVTPEDQFTPATSYRGFTPAERAALARLKVTPPGGGSPGQLTAGVLAREDRSASLGK